VTQKPTLFNKPGSRIAVIGDTGSGKTTLAAQLGSILAIPVIELDALHWMPGWTEKPRVEVHAVLDPMTQQQTWVTDGNYSWLRDVIWTRADTIIWLDYPFLIVFWRLFWRTLRRAAFREELWNSNRERFRDNFFSKDSLFLWLLKSRPKHKKTYPLAFQDPQYAQAQVIHFTHPRQTENWLKSLQKNVRVLP